MSGRGSKWSPRGRGDARSRALREWRGVDLGPLEQARRVTARSAAEVMPAALKEIDLDQKREDVEIVTVWNDLIDPEIVTHAKPANLHKGTLFVNVDSPVWKDEIVRYHSKSILKRLQDSFGREKIARISFRIG